MRLFVAAAAAAAANNCADVDIESGRSLDLHSVCACRGRTKRRRRPTQWRAFLVESCTLLISFLPACPTANHTGRRSTRSKCAIRLEPRSSSDLARNLEFPIIIVVVVVVVVLLTINVAVEHACRVVYFSGRRRRRVRVPMSNVSSLQDAGPKSNFRI